MNLNNPPLAIKNPTIAWPEDGFLENLSQRTIPLCLNYLSSGMQLQDLPKNLLPEFAFVGRSNVGKSSLLNYLAGAKQLARVSHTPGRTQTINLFIDDKEKFIFADLPGFGYAAAPGGTRTHWESSLQEYFEKRPGLCGIFLLIDIRRGIQEEEQRLAAWFHGMELKVIGILTKIDKLPKSQWPLACQEAAKGLRVSRGEILLCSAQKKVGFQDILKSMVGLIYATKITSAP